MYSICIIVILSDQYIVSFVRVPVCQCASVKATKGMLETGCIYFEISASDAPEVIE
jgi:hypothetical protein